MSLRVAPRAAWLAGTALTVLLAACAGTAPEDATAEAEASPTPTTRQATPLVPVDAIVVDELKRPLGPPKPVVSIDPGHPSEGNAGTTVQNGLQEVEVVYDVATKLAAMLEADGTARPVMTRDFRSYDHETGTRVTNRRRAEIANENGAAIFLRLHCDTGGGRGFAVYYPDREGTKEGRTGPPEALRAESLRAAEAIHGTMVEALGDTLKDNGVRGESRTYVGSRQGALTGSIYSEVPAVTVEMVVLSQEDDAAFIASEEGQQRLARALADGVAAYLAGRISEPPALAPPPSGSPAPP